MKKLFRTSEDSNNNACINFRLDPHSTYALGYKEAAQFLARNAANVSSQDFFVYPIAFLYRHHLELQLKWIIKLGCDFLDHNEA